MNTSSSFFRTLNTVGYAFLHLNINHYKASLTHSKKMATTCETKNSNFVTTNYKKKKKINSHLWTWDHFIEKGSISSNYLKHPIMYWNKSKKCYLDKIGVCQSIVNDLICSRKTNFKSCHFLMNQILLTINPITNINKPLSIRENSNHISCE